MLKSFSSLMRRKKRREELIRDFPQYIENIKRDFASLNLLIEDYGLNPGHNLAPQIETFLGRALTKDEKQTIQFAVNALNDGGYREIESPTRRPNHYSRKKKKKK
jgi:hypothetical protein